MRVVIANPPATLDNGKYILPFPSRCDWVGSMKPGSYYYPYELAYLSTLLKRDLPGAEVIMLDGVLYGLDAQQYTDLIRAHAPDVLIVEAAHLSYKTMTRILSDLPGVRGILTGPMATAFPDKVRADGWEPVAGEYEFKVLALLRGEPEPTEPINLDALPWPEDNDIPRLPYWEENCIVRPMIQAYATRGCTVRCAFCTSPMYYGGYDGPPSFRGRDVVDVADEVEYLIGRYPDMQGVFFNDETHNASPKWLRTLANEFIERGLNRISFEGMCGYWTVTEADIRLLARAGYKKLRFGVESLTVDRAGGARGKKVIPGKLERVLEWCNENGIYTHLTSMIGAWGSSEEGDLRTLDELLELKARRLAHSVQHSIATPNPGTAFWSMCQKNGYLVTDDPEEMHWHSGAVNYPNYTAEQIERVFERYYLLRLDWGRL